MNDKPTEGTVIDFKSRQKTPSGPSPGPVPETTPERKLNTFAVHDLEGNILTIQEGYLNIGPDFAAITDINNDILSVIQAHSYSLIERLTEEDKEDLFSDSVPEANASGSADAEVDTTPVG